MENSNIAIILARGGSKRIPKKNIIELNGKPLVAWTIEAALNSEKFSHVLLSTDSEEIADIGKSFGAEVPFLRVDCSDDQTPTSKATCSSLIQAEEYWGCRFDNVTQLMANCPLRTSTDIKNAVEHFYSQNSPSQLSCFRYGWMNPWWAFNLSSGERLFPEAWSSRSQDLGPLFCPSGAIWISTRSSLLSHQTYHVPNATYFELDWVSSVDIDDYDDLEMAKACFLLRSNS